MKQIIYQTVLGGRLPRRWTVYEDGELVGLYPTLEKAIHSDPHTIAYCPICFLNADQCADQLEHLEHWKW